MVRTIIDFILIGAMTCTMCYAVEAPIQTIENDKSGFSFNYDRQDSEDTGRQAIVNDHSWFNINIQIIKKGRLGVDSPKSEDKE